MNRDEVREHLTGPITSIRTPFKAHGEIDFDGLRRFIDFCIEAGSKTMLLTAGDSHYACLSDEEIAKITRTTVEQTRRRAMVVAADRYHSTDRAVAFAEFARGAGADVVMCLPPDWGKSCTPGSLAEHYAEVARAMPVMIVTNIFRLRGNAFGLETIERALEASDNIVAIKDDMGGAFAQRLCLMANPVCAVFPGGRKVNHLNMFPFGCGGYMSTYQCFYPEIAHRYWSAVQEGKMESAWSIALEYDEAYYDLIDGFTGGWNAGIHATLELFGIAGRWRRKPYAAATDGEMEQLKAFFHDRSIR